MFQLAIHRKWEIHLPTDTELEDDLGYFINAIRIANQVPGWETLILTYHQRMLKLVYLASRSLYGSTQKVLVCALMLIALRSERTKGGR